MLSLHINHVVEVAPKSWIASQTTIEFGQPPILYGLLKVAVREILFESFVGRVAKVISEFQGMGASCIWSNLWAKKTASSSWCPYLPLGVCLVRCGATKMAIPAIDGSGRDTAKAPIQWMMALLLFAFHQKASWPLKPSGYHLLISWGFQQTRGGLLTCSLSSASLRRISRWPRPGGSHSHAPRTFSKIPRDIHVWGGIFCLRTGTWNDLRIRTLSVSNFCWRVTGSKALMGCEPGRVPLDTTAYLGSRARSQVVKAGFMVFRGCNKVRTILMASSSSGLWAAHPSMMKIGSAASEASLSWHNASLSYVSSWGLCCKVTLHRSRASRNRVETSCGDSSKFGYCLSIVSCYIHQLYARFSLPCINLPQTRNFSFSSESERILARLVQLVSIRMSLIVSEIFLSEIAWSRDTSINFPLINRVFAGLALQTTKTFRVLVSLRSKVQFYACVASGLSTKWTFQGQESFNFRLKCLCPTLGAT